VLALRPAAPSSAAPLGARIDRGRRCALAAGSPPSRPASGVGPLTRGPARAAAGGRSIMRARSD